MNSTVQKKEKNGIKLWLLTVAYDTCMHTYSQYTTLYNPPKSCMHTLNHYGLHTYMRCYTNYKYLYAELKGVVNRLVGSHSSEQALAVGVSGEP